ncbi:Vgb family protein [Streptomyces sp. URMC 124]|uniref:Vgb family protein n=1 Tax=Streptomyces sp. URMC 124 TaxID=3423405 RepID=UPI003F1D35E3
MADDIMEYSLGASAYAPHSVCVGNAGKLWVTTSNTGTTGSGCVVRVNPQRPSELSYANHSHMPRLSAGIMKDPLGGAKVWFAAPAPPQQEDPIAAMLTSAGYPITFYPLEDDAKAESIALETTKVGGSGTPTYEYSLLFAEPVHKYVGVLPVTPSGAGQVEKMHVEHNTWLWDVAVSTDTDGKTHTYWVTGQTNSNPSRTQNGLYKRAPRQSTWEHIALPGGPSQKPFYVKVDTEAVWVTATNPNQVLRYNLNTLRWKERNLSAVPQQLAFAPNGEVWVASSAGIHVFDGQMEEEGSTILLPQGGRAKGICVGSDGNVWYTNPDRKTIGRYPTAIAAMGAPSRLGRTQVVSHTRTVLHAKEHADAPLVAEYVADGRPIPGIPLTCRVEAEGATFDDNTRERVILTDQRGRVCLPPVYAGDIEEDALLSIGLGNTEPHATTTLHIRPA